MFQFAQQALHSLTGGRLGRGAESEPAPTPEISFEELVSKDAFPVYLNDFKSQDGHISPEFVEQYLGYVARDCQTPTNTVTPILEYHPGVGTVLGVHITYGDRPDAPVRIDRLLRLGAKVSPSDESIVPPLTPDELGVGLSILKEKNILKTRDDGTDEASAIYAAHAVAREQVKQAQTLSWAFRPEHGHGISDMSPWLIEFQSDKHAMIARVIEYADRIRGQQSTVDLRQDGSSNTRVAWLQSPDIAEVAIASEIYVNSPTVRDIIRLQDLSALLNYYEQCGILTSGQSLQIDKEFKINQGPFQPDNVPVPIGTLNVGRYEILLTRVLFPDLESSAIALLPNRDDENSRVSIEKYKRRNDNAYIYVVQLGRNGEYVDPSLNRLIVEAYERFADVRLNEAETGQLYPRGMVSWDRRSPFPEIMRRGETGALCLVLTYRYDQMAAIRRGMQRGEDSLDDTVAAVMRHCIAGLYKTLYSRG